jgi:hypothetical protein
MQFTIIVSPKRARVPRAAPDLYDARLADRDVVLCSSKEPFLDSARELLRLALARPEDTLRMRHEGSTTVALTSSVGAAAALAVSEANGRPRFVPWRQFAGAVSPPAPGPNTVASEVASPALAAQDGDGTQKNHVEAPALVEAGE